MTRDNLWSFVRGVLVLSAACSSEPSAPAPMDAAIDRAAPDAPVTSDLGPEASAARCMSDRECSARGEVCNAARGECVECNTARDCTDGRACLGGRCVMVTPCTSSRMCPGQVCSMRLGHCVDCEQDVDCTGGTVCRSNVCVAPPRPCRSSRECSDINQVCAPMRGHCVDCVLDTDCAPGSYCGPELTCHPRVCVPNASSCVSATRARLCNAVGSMARDVDCPAGQTCRNNTCQPPVCAPGQASCDPMTGGRRRCMEDGGGYAPMPCAEGESCRDGGCVPRACAPGSATCASLTERRVCAVDGLTTMVVACAAGEGCRDGVCVPRSCAPGSATCMSAMVRSVCNADGFGTTPMPCASNQRCTSGSCMNLVCTPGSSTCAGSTAVRVCNGEGTGTMDVPCPASSTCAGTMCTSWLCAPGSVTCPAGATARSVCSSDGLRTTSDPCVAPANANTPRCGAGNACEFTCNAGFGDCNMLAADGCEVTFATNVAHCGRCGNACPPRTGMIASCAAGVCDYRCPAGQTVCGGACVNLLHDVANCGACGMRCAAGLSCVAGVCSREPTFRIDELNLTPSMCRLVQHVVPAGDDRGGIAISSSRVFYTGDEATIHASLADLSGISVVSGMQRRHDGLVHDIASGEVYVLMNASGAEIASPFGGSFAVTQLGVIDGTNGSLTPTRIPLSTPVSVTNDTGIFSGRGRAFIHAGSLNTWYQIALPSGVVTVLRAAVTAPTHATCENWAYWGVAEFFDSEAHAVYAESGTRIVRYRIRDGMTTPLATGSFSDLCSFTVSPANNRWYFHYEGSGFAGGGDESLAYCPARTSTP